MIIRSGFVSNSSSSSFLCEISLEAGEHDTSDPVTITCDRGHEFCKSYLADPFLENSFSEGYDTIGRAIYQDQYPGEEIVPGENAYENYSEYFDDYLSEHEWCVPSAHCPICQGKEYSFFDLVRVLMADRQLNNRTDLENLVARRFRTYDQLHEYTRQTSIYAGGSLPARISQEFIV